MYPDTQHTETAITIDPATADLTPSPRVHINENRKKSRPPEKFVTAFAAGLLSLVPIILAYMTFQRPDDLLDHPVGPLVAAAVVMIVNKIAFSWLCTLGTRTTSIAALFPISFAVFGGTMAVIPFGAALTSKTMERIEMTYRAVLISAVLFSGIALGATVEYLAYVKNEQKERAIAPR